MDENHKKLLWEKYTNAVVSLAIRRNADWDRLFRVDALMIRDELRSRLKGYKPEKHVDDAYQNPTNFFGVSVVATDLERMAKLLQKTQNERNP